MNKIVIPISLTAIVLIAGIFAISPIEKASTVHTQIINANVVRVVDFDTTDFNANDELEVRCTGGGALLQAIMFEDIAGGLTAADSMSLRFDVDGAAGGNWGEVTINGDIFGTNAPVDTEILERAAIVAPIGLTTGGEVRITFDTAGSGGVDTVRAMFVLTTDSATTCTNTGDVSN